MRASDYAGQVVKGGVATFDPTGHEQIESGMRGAGVDLSGAWDPSGAGRFSNF